MPLCEHCDEQLSTLRDLKRHRMTTLYCLEIQKKKGLEVQPSQHKCRCGTTCTTKSSLTRHEKSCQITVTAIGAQSTAISNINSNNTTTNNITINQTITPAKRFTMSDLTKEYILARLTPVVTKEICKSGMGAITELVVEVLLQRDGKYCYYCSDKSRKKFVMVIDHDGQVIEEKDPNSQCLRSIISIPLEEIVSVITEKHTIKAIQQTYDEVSELARDGSGFSATLASSLPCDADGIPESMKAQVEAAKDAVSIQKLEDTRQRIKAKITRKAMLEECPYLKDKI